MVWDVGKEGVSHLLVICVVFVVYVGWGKKVSI